jgi:hypothetical protein
MKIARDAALMTLVAGLAACGAAKDDDAKQGPITMELEGGLLNGGDSLVGSTCQGIRFSGTAVQDFSVQVTAAGADGLIFYEGFENLECIRPAATPGEGYVAFGKDLPPPTLYFVAPATATSVTFKATSEATTIEDLTTEVVPVALEVDAGAPSGGTFTVDDCVEVSIRHRAAKKDWCISPNGLLDVSLTAADGGATAAFYSDKDCTAKVDKVVIDGVEGGGRCGTGAFFKGGVAGTKATVTAKASTYADATATLQY